MMKYVWGPELFKQLMGSHSRPTTMRRTIERRQPQAEMHLLWSEGVPKKGLDESARRRQAELDKDAEARKVIEQRNRLLVKKMRKQIQARMKDTHNLPRNLWKYFKDADADGSGRIEYPEYVKVMTKMGLGVEEMGDQNLGTLFRLADKDNNSNIDFNEFLRTVVGNFVSL